MNITKKYKVTPIHKNEIADWLLKKHYAHKIPSVKYQFGLFDDKGILQGVCCYGSSASYRNNNMGRFKQIELVRLVVNEGLPKNTLSFFVSQTFKLLPKPLSLISYSDQAYHHHGYIYQATNWIYTGKSSFIPNFEFDDGSSMHNRSVSQIKAQYPHLSKVEVAEMLGMKEKFGSSKHRYFYFIGNKKDKKEWIKILKSRYNIEPYPKGENRRYNIPKDKYKVCTLDI